MAPTMPSDTTVLCLVVADQGLCTQDQQHLDLVQLFMGLWVAQNLIRQGLLAHMM